MIRREFFKNSLYKYMKREHAKKMLSGEIRIGTLGNYRAVEKYGPQVGDLNEGLVDYIHIKAHDPKKDKEPLPDLRSIGISFGSVSERGNMSEFHLRPPNPVKMRDYYIYSTAKEFDEGLFKAFDEYDTCVEIFKPNEFFDSIRSELASKISRFNVASCQYGEKVVVYDHGLVSHAALIKSREYAHQKEVRMYAKPIVDFPQPVIIKSKLIKSYVRIHTEK